MTPLLVLAMMALPGQLPDSIPTTVVSPTVEITKDYCGLEPGDLVIFQTSNIAWNVFGPLLLCGSASHAGIAVARPDGGVVILETPVIGAKVALLDPCPRIEEYKGRVWTRRRITPLTPEQSEKLTSFAWTQAGKKYDYLGLACLPVKMPFRMLPGSSESGKHPSRFFCSELVLTACIEAGLIDGRKVHPGGAAPEDLRSDMYLDLSSGWHTPVLHPKCKR